jgi:hypothetical protein
MNIRNNTDPKDAIEKRLQEIADTLQTLIRQGNKNGLSQGKMGIVIFLFHYARYTDNISYEDTAYTLIEDLQASLSNLSSLNYADGLTGMGVGIEYLVQQQFLDADTDEVLEDLDVILNRQLRERKLYLSLQMVIDIRKYFYMRLENPKTKKRAFLNDAIMEATALIQLHTNAFPFDCGEVVGWGMFEGYAGLGLTLLSTINEDHNTWKQLLL